jgi:hypothetical protein
MDLISVLNRFPGLSRGILTEEDEWKYSDTEQEAWTKKSAVYPKECE